MTGEELARHLGYPVPDPARPDRPDRVAVRMLAGSRAASWVLARTLAPIDAGLGALTGQRLSAPGLLAGLPVITLTTVGARTGQARQVRLIPVVTPRLFGVLGTNFGGRQTPAWVTNILANPEATVRFRDESVSVVAVELAGADRAGLLRAAVGVYPGFGRYETRARHRRVHVFALDHDPPNDTG